MYNFKVGDKLRVKKEYFRSPNAISSWIKNNNIKEKDVFILEEIRFGPLIRRIGKVCVVGDFASDEWFEPLNKGKMTNTEIYQLNG